MKKMKGVSPLVPSPYAVYEDPRARFKHHTLLQDYHDLQKEAEVVKETLERAKQKKLTLLAEVSFLRRRYKYLTRKQSPNPQPKHGLVQSQKSDPWSRNNVKERKSSRKTAALHCAKDAVFQNSAPVIIDLNVKERTSTGKEATVQNTHPVFDLNQISREEEEELNGGQLRFEEPVKSSMRIVNDEQQNDIKLSVCRNIGNGTSRAGKRKITWQDQVALRV